MHTQAGTDSLSLLHRCIRTQDERISFFFLYLFIIINKSHEKTTTNNICIPLTSPVCVTKTWYSPCLHDFQLYSHPKTMKKEPSHCIMVILCFTVMNIANVYSSQQHKRIHEHAQWCLQDRAALHTLKTLIRSCFRINNYWPCTGYIRLWLHRQ